MNAVTCPFMSLTFIRDCFQTFHTAAVMIGGVMIMLILFLLFKCETERYKLTVPLLLVPQQHSAAQPAAPVCDAAVQPPGPREEDACRELLAGNHVEKRYRTLVLSRTALTASRD